MAKPLLRALEPYRPLFVEEPVLAEQSEYYRRLSDMTSIPLAAGERMFSRFEFKRVLEQGGLAVLQPDLSHAGGISECLRIAAMAEAYDVTLAPHCPLGPVALAACLQVDFVSYNAVLQEQSMGIHYNKGAELLDYVHNADDFRMEGGYIAPLPLPGLGVDINEERVIEASRAASDWERRPACVASPGEPATGAPMCWGPVEPACASMKTPRAPWRRRAISPNRCRPCASSSNSMRWCRS